MEQQKHAHEVILTTGEARLIRTLRASVSVAHTSSV